MANKYKAQRTGKYASKKEANHAAILHALHAQNKILSLQEQVRFELLPKFGKERALVYVADFVYDEYGRDGWVRIVEDVKGFKTPVYRLKKRLMKQLLGIEIREV